MKKWLSRYYTQPYHGIYLTLNFLFTKRIIILCVMGLMILVYPTTQFIFIKQQLAKIMQQQAQQQDLILNKTKWLTHINQSYQAKNENQLAQFNQQIKSILTKYNAITEQIQWHFLQETQEKRATLVFSQNTKSVLNIIQALAQIELLKINEITLSKHPKKHLVQAYLQLTFK